MDYQARLNLWRSLGNTGDLPAGWYGPGNDANNSQGYSGNAQYDSQLMALNDSVDKYINDTMGENQGRADLFLKNLDSQHEQAIGSGDAERASFLEKVADQYEKKVGRIPYDYEKYTSREIQDNALSSNRLGEAKNRALSRLSEDEKVATANETRNTGYQKRALGEDLNSRGILSTPVDQANGLAGKAVGEFNTEANTRMDAMKRAYARSNQDTTMSYDQQLQDRATQNQRTLDDLKTGARRGVLDENSQYNYARDTQNMDLATKKKALERERAYGKLDNRSRALTGLTG